MSSKGDGRYGLTALDPNLKAAQTSTTVLEIVKMFKSETFQFETNVFFVTNPEDMSRLAEGRQHQ